MRLNNYSVLRRPGKQILRVRQLKKSKWPVVLTVNGKAAAVVQDAEAYQSLLDLAVRTDAVEGMRHGKEDMRKGRVRPAKELMLGENQAARRSVKKAAERLENFGKRHKLSLGGGIRIKDLINEGRR
jgi:PHD/YefM family antitoxin component YafN of YafNO toxin-antitoxin module